MEARWGDFTSPYPTGVQGVDPTFLAQVRIRPSCRYSQATGASGSVLGTLLSFLPSLLFFGYFVYKSRTKVIDADRPTTTFADVA